MNVSRFIDKNIQFHDTLNPEVWNGTELDHEVRYHLLQIAEKFIESLEIEDFPLMDIQLTGSMASYNYTPYSDFDVHVVYDHDDLGFDDKLVEQLFQAKKAIWNDHYPITIHGYSVELYAESSKHPPVSNGTFSIIDNVWLTEPVKEKPTIDNHAVAAKTRDLMGSIDTVVSHDDIDGADSLRQKIIKMRKSGIAEAGMYGAENLAFKILRNQGFLAKLSKFIKNKTTQDLSLPQ